MDDVDLGSHAFSESYIREEARWAFVDPTNDIAYVTNSAGNVLRGADIYTTVVTGTDSSLTARALNAGNFSSVPFSTVAANVRYFMHPDNFLIYVGSHDGRYQMQGTGPVRYLRQLYRFLFQPQQYFGYTHFVSFPWIRAATLFTCIISILFAVVFAIVGVKAK